MSAMAPVAQRLSNTHAHHGNGDGLDQPMFISNDSDAATHLFVPQKSGEPTETDFMTSESDFAEPPYRHDSQQTGPLNTTLAIARWWWIEILASAVSMAAIGAQAIILYMYADQPQYTWPSRVLTLNGLIAILATLARASLMMPIASSLAQAKWNRFAEGQSKTHRLSDFGLFDEASRGAYGSIQLLWRFKGVLHVSCLGALISIASLALSTFSQQVVDLRTILVQSHNPEITEQIGVVTRTLNTGGILLLDPEWEGGLKPAMSLAIYNGFLAPAVPQIAIPCPTGNCTWPEFPTLGVCNVCDNITSEIKQVRAPDATSTAWDDLGRFELDNGLWIGSDEPGSSDSSSILVAVNNTNTGRIFDRPGLQGLLADNSTVIGEFTVLAYTEGTDYSPRGIAASECAMWICVQSRRVAVSDGRQTESITKSWASFDQEPDLAEGYGYFVDLPAPFRSDKFTGHLPAMSVLRDSMARRLSGNVTFNRFNYFPIFSSDYMQGIHDSKNDTAGWLARVSESITNALREQSPVYQETGPYNGTAAVNDVFIVVRWKWLAYPAVLVLLSAVYLGFEITTTMQSAGAKPWEADALVPLCAMLDLDRNVLQAAAPGLDRPSGLIDGLGDFRVCLNHDGNGYVQLSGRLEGVDEGQENYGRVEQC